MDIVLLLVAFLFGLFVKDYFPSYTRKKAENLATKEDVEEITKKVEEVRSSIELNKELEKQFLNKKQEFLMKFFDEITEFHYEKLGVNFGDFPNDAGKSLFEYQNGFYRSVVEILKSYQRLVIFLPHDSTLLGYANVLTSCVLDSRKVMKDHFGSVKLSLINEYHAMLSNDDTEKRNAVAAADKANSKFWSEMKPSAERFREYYRNFLKELNDYVTPEDKN